MQARPMKRAPLAALLTLGCVSAAALSSTPAAAQERETVPGSSDEVDLRKMAELVATFVSALIEKGHEKLFGFLETVDLFDAEAEIDRLVGSPWHLNDSTAYKLSLLPFHIRYPIYRQLVRQMTRQDDLRSRPIHLV